MAAELILHIIICALFRFQFNNASLLWLVNSSCINLHMYCYIFLMFSCLNLSSIRVVIDELPLSINSSALERDVIQLHYSIPKHEISY